MIAYTIRRILSMIPALVLASVLIFLFMHIAPGDPAQLILGESATPEQVEELKEVMGLNKPLVVQYVTWINNILRGDFGNSYFFGSPVLQVITSHAEASLLIGFFTIILIILIGISIGIISAVKYNSLIDQALMTFAMLGASIPTFWSGLLSMLIFSVYLRWLPSSGFPSIITSGDLDNLKYLILPCIVLAIPNSALIIRITRASMLDILKEDYVRTARAKGLNTLNVYLKHVFRNSLIPIMSVLGFTFLHIVSSTVVTESVFSIPGIGRLVVQSITRRDYPVIQGVIIIITFMYMVINLFIDLLYAYLDPRIKYS